jgi:hypothetical protein
MEATSEPAGNSPHKHLAAPQAPANELTGATCSPPSSPTEESLQGRLEEAEKALPSALEWSNLNNPLSASDDLDASPKVGTPDQPEGKRWTQNPARDHPSLPGLEEVHAAEAAPAGPRPSAPRSDSAEAAEAEAEASGDQQATGPKVHKLGSVESEVVGESQQASEKAACGAPLERVEPEKEGEVLPILVHVSEAAGKSVPVPGPVRVATAGQADSKVGPVEVRMTTPEVAEAESETPVEKSVQGSGAPLAAAVEGRGPRSPPGAGSPIAAGVETLEEMLKAEGSEVQDKPPPEGPTAQHPGEKAQDIAVGGWDALKIVEGENLGATGGDDPLTPPADQHSTKTPFAAEAVAPSQAPAVNLTFPLPQMATAEGFAMAENLETFKPPINKQAGSPFRREISEPVDLHIRDPLRRGWKAGSEGKEAAPFQYSFGAQHEQPELGLGAASDADRCVVPGCGRKAPPDLANACSATAGNFHGSYSVPGCNLN